MPLSNYEKETLRINHQIRLAPQEERLKTEADAHAAQIKTAVENLQRALAADKELGLADSAGLRDVRPRPHPASSSQSPDVTVVKHFVKIQSTRRPGS